jgi:hypothetical protein
MQAWARTWKRWLSVAVVGSLSVFFVFLSVGRELGAIQSMNDSTVISRDENCPNIMVLPKWLEDYFEWHHEQRRLLTEDNWNDNHHDNQTHFKFLISRCLHSDNICGGTSDRLHSLPAKIRLAAKLNRIFLILWERPAKLEEFLVPPCGGLDWRVPDWLKDRLQPLLQNLNFTLHSTEDDYLQQVGMSKDQIIHTSWNMGKSLGADWYNEQLDLMEPTFEQVYHPLWAAVFQPSPPVQVIIDETLDKLNLMPSLYHALHIRSQYLTNETETPGLVKNATNCALFSYNDSTFMPLYIATDSTMATQHAMQYAISLNRSRVVARSSTKEPLHLDRGRDGFLAKIPNEPDLLDNPASYYETFVDLYLLSQAQCITFGRGRFGRWANLISANSSCSVSYFSHTVHQYTFPPSCYLPG